MINILLYIGFALSKVKHTPYTNAKSLQLRTSDFIFIHVKIAIDYLITN